MNTEQLKTGSESIAKKIISVPDNKPEHAADHKLREITEIVYYFASQESKRAVDEFKEKLKTVSPDEIRHALQLIQNALEDAPYSLGGLKEAWNIISDNLTKYEDLIDKL